MLTIVSQAGSQQYMVTLILVVKVCLCQCFEFLMLRLAILTIQSDFTNRDFLRISLGLHVKNGVDSLFLV